MNETHKNEPSVFGNLLRAAPGSENPMPLARYSEAIEKALVEEGVFNEAKNTDYWESAVRRHLLSSKPASTEWCEAAEK